VLSLVEPTVHKKVTEAKLQLFAEVSKLHAKQPVVEAPKLNLSDPSFMDKTGPSEKSNLSQQKQPDRDMLQQLEASCPELKNSEQPQASTNVKESAQGSPTKPVQTQPLKVMLPKSKADAFLTSLNKSEDLIQSFNKSMRENTAEIKELRTVMMEQLRKLQGSP
jgi:hypothetical protein